ncbi:hypothetical protein BH11CYA1_BH11CYA1_27210 [soil metagenome]
MTDANTSSAAPQPTQSSAPGQALDAPPSSVPATSIPATSVAATSFPATSVAATAVPASTLPPAPLYIPEPERPFRPHSFHPRAELLAKSPRVLITPDAYKNMSLYVEIASKEVGWLGTATLLPSGDILIDETYLLEQEVTSTETELSVEGQNKLVMDLVSQCDAGIDQTNRLRFWGHSHVRMGTSASGTDESTMVRFGRDGIPWYVRGIFNKLGRAEFTVYFYDLGYRIHDAPWAVWDPTEKRVILEGGRIFRRPRFWERQEEPLSVVTQVPTPATSAPSSGGLLTWPAPKADTPVQRPALPEYEPLPPILVPSDELRASVLAEFKAKVRERSYFGFSGWFSGNDKDAPAGSQPGASGDAVDANARYSWVRDAEGKWSRILDTSKTGPSGGTGAPASIPFGVRAPGTVGGDANSGPDDRHPYFGSGQRWSDEESWFDRMIAKLSAWLAGKPKDD